MPENRFYSPHPFQENQSISLKETEFHHLVNVMRAKVNDTIEVVNGKGELAYATITQIGKKEALLTITQIIRQAKPNFEIILAQAIPRLNRLDFIIEKGTELGMTKLWLFAGNHSERKKLTEDQIARMENVTISAMKQCGRLDLPQIKWFSSMNEIVIPPNVQGYFGDVSPDAPLLQTELKTSSVVLFIGPETGFSEQETALLKSWNVKGIKLHANILRTDTAALAALTIATHIL